MSKDDDNNRGMILSGNSNQMAVHETASSYAASQARAMVEARFAVALRYPRDEDEVRQKLMKECNRTSFARVAIYSKPVGGKSIEGPSIRFAEAALRMMRNIDIQTPTVYDDAEKRIVRVSVVDLESNLTYSLDITVEKTVERSKVREGQTVLRTRMNTREQLVHIVQATDDEVMVKQAALVSKAIRTNGLRMIPGDLIDEALSMVRETMKREDFSDPDAARNKIFDFMATLGVTVPMLRKWLGHDAPALTPKEISELRAISLAIKEGDTTWVEVMEAKEASEDRPATARPSGLGDAIDTAGRAGKPATKEQGNPPVLTAQDVHDAIMASTTIEHLAQADLQIAQVPKSEHKVLREFIAKRRYEITHPTKE
jgi:hypothetical protein